MPRTIDLDERRAELAEALWQVIRERGIGAVSVRTVAAQAGLAVGSLRHVFPTRAELLEFSAQLMVERASARILDVLNTPIPSPHRASNRVRHALSVVEHLLPLTPDSRSEMEVNLALIAEAPALPSLTTIRDYAADELERLCVGLAAMLSGRPEKRCLTAGRRLHALVDGLALHLLAAPAASDPAWALKILHAELTDIAGLADPRKD